MTTPVTTVVVTDTNILVVLMQCGWFSLLWTIPAHRFVIPDHVHAEVTDPTQQAALDSALGAGHLDRARTDDPAALADFVRLLDIVDPGEAECIALGTANGWHVATDDKAAIREAARRLGAERVLTTVGLFVLAIEARVLTIEEADAAKTLLATRRFVMTGFASFAEIVQLDTEK